MTERKKIKEVPGTCYGSTSCLSSSSEGFLWTDHKTRIMGVLPYLTLFYGPLTHRGKEGHNGRREGHDKHP
jgi:hypothetical protein